MNNSKPPDCSTGITTETAGHPQRHGHVLRDGRERQAALRAKHAEVGARRDLMQKHELPFGNLCLEHGVAPEFRSSQQADETERGAHKVNIKSERSVGQKVIHRSRPLLDLRTSTLLGKTVGDICISNTNNHLFQTCSLQTVSHFHNSNNIYMGR